MKLLSGVKECRQLSALERLEKQLQSGVKTYKGKAGLMKNKTTLSEKDIKRIKQEIEILKSRV